MAYKTLSNPKTKTKQKSEDKIYNTSQHVNLLETTFKCEMQS